MTIRIDHDLNSRHARVIAGAAVAVPRRESAWDRIPPAFWVVLALALGILSFGLWGG